MSDNAWIYIDNQQQLAQACHDMAQHKTLCIDTEFHRETTYYPEFALVQVYASGQCWLIDPIAIDDLSIFWEVICNPDILKVFHAGRQDIEIIVKASGKLPLPLFDTQIAAALLGYGQQVGFGNLVQRIVKKNLAKQESFSDWLARPLTAKQLAYAADDVIWLMPVFQHLHDALTAKGRIDWLQEEQATLCNLATYQEDPQNVFWRVKGVNKLKGKALAVLRELAAWRELEAQKRNLPRRRLLADEPLLEIARKDKLNEETMLRMRGLSQGIVKRFAKDMIAAWQQGMACPSEQWPKVQPRNHNTAGTDMRLELLSTLLRLKAEEGEIASSILSSKAELSALASWGLRCNGSPPKVACLEGWRYQLVGQDLLHLLRGELCLHIDSKSGLPTITSITPNSV